VRGEAQLLLELLQLEEKRWTSREESRDSSINIFFFHPSAQWTSFGIWKAQQDYLLLQPATIHLVGFTDKDKTTRETIVKKRQDTTPASSPHK